MDRTACCADWPKPCQYHQGWEDGREDLEEALGFYAEGLHIGYRDSSDMRVDGDPYVRDRGEIASVALGLEVKGAGHLKEAYGWWLSRNPMTAEKVDRLAAVEEARR